MRRICFNLYKTRPHITDVYSCEQAIKSYQNKQFSFKYMNQDIYNSTFLYLYQFSMFLLELIVQLGFNPPSLRAMCTKNDRVPPWHQYQHIMKLERSTHNRSHVTAWNANCGLMLPIPPPLFELHASKSIGILLSIGTYILTSQNAPPITFSRYRAECKLWSFAPPPLPPF